MFRDRFIVDEVNSGAVPYDGGLRARARFLRDREEVKGLPRTSPNDIEAYFAELARKREALDRFLGRVGNMTRRGYTDMYESTHDTVIVGGGLNAAVYAATMNSYRVKRRPVMLERDSVGGVFGWSDVPRFALNSANRPGTEGVPGEYDRSLNYLPNCAVQLASLSAAQYPAQNLYGLAILVNLLLYADGYIADVKSISRLGSRARGLYGLEVMRGAARRTVLAKRVILGTGVGESKTLPIVNAGSGAVIESDPRVRTFEEFVKGGRPGGTRRVAVIGGGNSGDATVESLLGLGVAEGDPVAFDYVESVDWYGQDCVTQGIWRASSRARYASIGGFLPNAPDEEFVPFPSKRARLSATGLKVNKIIPESRGVRVEYGYGPFRSSELQVSRLYDLVVVCIGFENKVNDLLVGFPDTEATYLGRSEVRPQEEIVYDENGLRVARKIKGEEIYKIGPCGDLPVTKQEIIIVPSLLSIPGNSAASWRYTRRTARLAEMLHATGKERASMRTSPVGPIPGPVAA